MLYIVPPRGGMVMIKVRAFRKGEKAFLEAKIKEKTLPTRIYQRYQIIWQRAEDIKPGEIAQRNQLHPHTIRLWIKRFNQEGFIHFEERERPGGRPNRIKESTKTKLIQIALSRPKDLGEPYTQWSLMKLKEYIERIELVDSISPEGIRKILRASGLSYQRTKTWKESPDPQFEIKKMP
jgi:transposase